MERADRDHERNIGHMGFLPVGVSLCVAVEELAAQGFADLEHERLVRIVQVLGNSVRESLLSERFPDLC